MNKNQRVVAESTEKVDPVVALYRRDIASVSIIGLATGVITWAAMTLLERFVFVSVMCRDGASDNCDQAASYALIVAMILGALAALVALVQARIYRPLLVVITATAALWGFNSQLFSETAWYLALPVTAVLFALTYLLFTWIARLRSFILAVVISVVLVVIIRFTLNA